MHFARTKNLTVVASFAWLLVGVTSTYKRMVWCWCYETPWKMLLIVATSFCCNALCSAITCTMLGPTILLYTLFTHQQLLYYIHCTTGHYLTGLRRRGSLISGIGVIQFLSKMVVHTFCLAPSCGLYLNCRIHCTTDHYLPCLRRCSKISSCHSLNSTSTQVESDKVISGTTHT
jgi:hypothetical protein